MITISATILTVATLFGAFQLLRPASAQQTTKPSPDDGIRPTVGGKKSPARVGNGKATRRRAGDSREMPGDMILNGNPGSLPSDFYVVVDDTLNLTQAQEAVYQQMATDLNAGVGVPQDRLNYYSAVNSPPNYVITAWGGVIENVVPNGNGYLVTVAVTVSLSTTAYGSATYFTDSDYSEIYQVTNNVPQYVGFNDPAGLSGTMPVAFIGL